MITDQVEVTLNDSQALITLVNANTTYCLWPRAGGKTSGGIGPRILRLSEVMPRSQILIFSDTYERLENRVIPNIMNFFIEKLGMVEGLDFIKYKRPPDHWTKPLVPLDRFEKVISFPSGMALCLVSLAVEGSANAFNAQAAIGDEVKFLKESDINTEVIPALRGAVEDFGHLPEYLSKWFFTDKFGPNIKWLLAKRKLVNERAVKIVLTLQYEIINLEAQIESNQVSKSKKYLLTKLIEQYKEKADRIRKHLVYVSDMKPYENMAVVGKFYFKSQKRTCKKYEFDIAILNNDPDKVENTFYPTFTQENKYKGIDDYNPMEPIIGAMDYNFRISPIPIVQRTQLPDSVYTTTNVIDYIYVLHPLGIEDAINDLCKKYASHQNKTIHFIYDQTAIPRNPIKTTFKDVVINTFSANGWCVVEHFIGEQPDHDIKHENIKKWLEIKGEDAVRVNESACDQLIKSIEQSPAIIVNGATKKDKRTEKDPLFPAEDSTHGSDAFDMILWGLYEWDVKSQINNTIGMDMKMS
ncbi:MAG: hypothetical protein M0Q26_05860 [Chitinophagaceae bacterium]|nr:hypothetical protein [Chitinophagaceae bacterium]MDP1763408.1 hypothetical protein [Sediminibacterium sp.]